MERCAEGREQNTSDLAAPTTGSLLFMTNKQQQQHNTLAAACRGLTRCACNLRKYRVCDLVLTLAWTLCFSHEAVISAARNPLRDLQGSPSLYGN